MNDKDKAILALALRKGSISSHEALAGHHEKLSKAHEGHGALSKTAAEAMDDGHEMKAHMAKTADFHKAAAGHHADISKTHKAMAEAMKAEVSELEKVAGVPAAAAAGEPAASGKADPAEATGNAVSKVFDETINNLMLKATEQIKDSPAIAKMLEQALLEKFNQVLGTKVIPDNVRGMFTTENPTVTPITRPGQPTLVKNDQLEPELVDLVPID